MPLQEVDQLLPKIRSVGGARLHAGAGVGKVDGPHAHQVGRRGLSVSVGADQPRIRLRFDNGGAAGRCTVEILVNLTGGLNLLVCRVDQTSWPTMLLRRWPPGTYTVARNEGGAMFADELRKAVQGGDTAAICRLIEAIPARDWSYPGSPPYAQAWKDSVEIAVLHVSGGSGINTYDSVSVNIRWHDGFRGVLFG